MENFNFNKDFYAACMVFGEKDGGRLAMAFLRYGYDGIEPNELPPSLNAAFILARGRIDAMVRGSQGGRQGAKAKKVRNESAATQGTTQGTTQQKEKEKEKEDAPKGASEKSANDAINAAVADVIAHLNAKCGTAYKPNSETSRQCIGARLSEGFTAEECKKAIDNVAAQWLDDDEMRRFLRPTTIFGKQKFESYLNMPRQEGGENDERYAAYYDLF